MDVRYINPFLVSVRKVFDMMLNMPFTLGKPHLKAEALPHYDISGIIGLTGSVTGSVVISLSKSLALQLAGALSGEEFTEVNEDCTDAIGEIANMIAGGAKKNFPGDGSASISTPSVVVGKHHVAYPSNMPIISIPCDTSAGRLAIDVALKETAVHAAAKA